MARLRTALVVLAVAAAASVASAQPAGQPFRPSPSSPVDDGAWYPLIVTGGRAALDALGVPPSADLGSTMVELVRRLHLSAGPPPELNAGILELSLAVGDLGRLQNAVAAASAGQPPTLALASQRESRKRFEAALGAAGLMLRESNNQHTVEANPSERETALRARLKTVGVDVEAIRSGLLKGEPLTFTVPTLELPLPLSPRAWTARILERSVPPSELFTAILSDRRARVLYHGLVGLDANTRRWISNQRGVLKHLYRDEESVRSFALFGPAVHVADGRVVVPGGPAAARRWSILLGADPAVPDQFITRLFDTEAGRVAGLYFTAAGVDERSRQFMLGLSNPAADGDARFARLASVFADCYPKQSTRYPFNLRSYDPALLLTQIPLTEKGMLAGPRWRRFWELGLSGDSLPIDSASELGDVATGGEIDAAWLVENLCARNVAERRAVYETLLFGHRVFSNSGDRELPDQLVAIRARRLYPAVVMAVEQAGISSSRIFARLARHAELVGRVDDPARAITATQQFQGALALTIGTIRAQSVTLEEGHALLEALAATPFEDGRYHGGVATWLARAWVPAVRPVGPSPGRAGTIEQTAATALAGRATASDPSISWEGLRYVVDFAGMKKRRLDAVRAREGGLTLDDVLELERIVSGLRQNAVDLARVGQYGRDLAQLVPRLADARPAEEFGEDAIEVRAAIDEVVRDIEKIKAPGELSRVPAIGRRLSIVLDFLTGHVLAAWAYAPQVGEADGPALVGGDPSLRHQFGVRLVGSTKSTQRWTVSRFGFQESVISGSLLGLEATLAKWSLRRLATDEVPAGPQIGGNDMASFLLTVALSDGRRLTDQSRDRITGAIAAGIAAVERAGQDPEALDALAVKAVMSPWTRQVISWLVTVAPAEIPAKFSAAELARIGDLVPSTVHEWGTASLLSGCLCILMPEGRIPELIVGRPADGLMATQTADIMLRIAWWLAELKLPASLASPVMAYAMRDFLDRVKPSHMADFHAFARQARAIDRRSVEDYVGAIAAVGPLRPLSQE
jgi:hypothetical protein